MIGLGEVAYGTSLLDQTAADSFNMTDHAIELTGLSLGTTYQFRASNKHAIDGGELASATSQFTTASAVPTAVFNQARAEPRVIQSGQVSNISITTKNQGQPVCGVVVDFAINPSNAGVLSSPQPVTGATGIATVQFTGADTGPVRIDVTASNPTNSPLNTPLVVR